jgi:GMP reductase
MKKKNEDLTKIIELINAKWICVDVANGYMKKVVDYCFELRQLFPDKIIVAGNVATKEMVEDLILNGKVDGVKIGIGPGSACLTRMKTGVGIPQLSAIIECADAAHGCGGFIIGMTLT